MRELSKGAAEMLNKTASKKKRQYVKNMFVEKEISPAFWLPDVLEADSLELR